MRYLSLFSGIGGFELGIEQAYVETTTRGEKRGGEVNTETDQGERFLAAQGKDITDQEGQSSKHSGDEFDQGQPSCVGYSEIDKYAVQIYQKHFPNHINFGDITKINPSELPDFDCLVGGFPCQAFSIAGKRRGFDDTRGTLFFDIARILKEKCPRLFVLENVKGLLSHDNGRTFKVIITTLIELGYDLQWQVLNSKNHGVPQNRERVFIIGNLGGTSRPQVFPFVGTGEEDTRNVGEDVAYTIDANYHKGTNTLSKGRRSVVGTLRTHKYGQGFREVKSGLAPTIPARAREDGSGQPVINVDMRIRRLTPRECERLQSFPDDWTDSVSDTQRYKCLGNAVTVNVIRDIFRQIN